jgi:hypothetical protein
VDKLNRQLSAPITNDDPATLVTQLHRDDRLVMMNLHDAPQREAHIVRSMGLTS